jgi:hypothetical protein
MMNCLGEPLSKSFFRKSFSTYLERFFRIGKFSPELPVLTLTDAEQGRILRNSI